MKPVAHNRAAVPRLVALLLALVAACSTGPVDAQAAGQLTRQLLPSGGSGAQVAFGDAGPSGTSDAAEPAGPAPLPTVSELIPRVVGLGQDADAAVDTVAEIADVSSLEPRVESLKQSQAEIAARLDGLESKDYVRDERVQAVLEQALGLQGQVDEAMSAASTRVERLDALRETWQHKQELWSRWKDSLRDDPQFREVYRDQFTQRRARARAGARGGQPGPSGPGRSPAAAPGGGRGGPGNGRERPAPAPHLAPEPVPPDRAAAPFGGFPGRAPRRRLR